MGPTSRDQYRGFSVSEGSVPLFLRAWWLDATCGPDGWDVSLCRNGDTIVGALPYAIKNRLGMRVLTQPNLTQFLGPWIASTKAKTAERLAREKDIMSALISQLPPHAYYSQSWSPTITNWLAFHWAGFQQTTRYTYVISLLADEGTIWNGLQTKIRGDVRKAETRFGVRMREAPMLEDFIAVNNKTFERQGLRTPYSKDYLAKLDQACAQMQCRKIFIAEDQDGRAHAGAYIVWDAKKAYYIAGGGDPDLRNSGATSYCLWQVIRFAASVSEAFDFEGSMMEPVERFFRGFGAEQVPYFYVTHTPSRLLRLRSALLAMR